MLKRVFIVVAREFIQHDNEVVILPVVGGSQLYMITTRASAEYLEGDVHFNPLA
jgi:hypothetical protein